MLSKMAQNPCFLLAVPIDDRPLSITMRDKEFSKREPEDVLFTSNHLYYELFHLYRDSDGGGNIVRSALGALSGCIGAVSFVRR